MFTYVIQFFITYIFKCHIVAYVNDVAAVFIAKNAVLSSFALGRQTSLVVDAGHEATVGALHISSIIWGYMGWLVPLIFPHTEIR